MLRDTPDGFRYLKREAGGEKPEAGSGLDGSGQRTRVDRVAAAPIASARLRSASSSIRTSRSRCRLPV
jgi:hypothetical protein